MLDKRLRHWWGWPWFWGLVGGCLVLQVGAHFWAEGLWFQNVGYADTFRLRVWTQLCLGLVTTGVSGAVLWGNLFLARRLPAMAASVRSPAYSAKVRPPGLGLRSLLLLACGLAALMGIQILYLGQVAIRYWVSATSVYNPLPPLPLWTKLSAVKIILDQLIAQPWQIGVLVGMAIAFLLVPQFCTTVAAIFTSAILGLVLSEQWTKVLPALSPVPFNQVDPLFGQDISFYVLRLPFWEVLQFWLVSLVLFALVSVVLTYLLSGDSLGQGRFIGFSPAQQRHLYGLGGGLMVATSLSHWLGRYQILYSARGVVYGASYTDTHVTLPAYTALSILALALGASLLWRTAFWSVSLGSLLEWLGKIGSRRYATLPPLPYRPLSARPILWGVFLYGLLAIAGGLVAPLITQRLVVQPNELQRETPYLERAIALTRDAFGLSDIDVKPFQPEGDLNTEILEENNLTIDNVRLWDSRPLLESNRQLQQIRLYYEFSDADFDRYTLRTPEGGEERRQVLISARELNYQRVPPDAQTWVNEHLIYTHGYGFTLSPVNTADEDGLPSYFIKDIAHTPSSEAIGQSIPVESPRIYFGELTDTYVMTNTRVRELDYPSGSENVYTTYEGRGGIVLNSLGRRFLFAWHLKDWQMLFTEDFSAETRLLYRRRITDRVQAIAPFLRFDSDPYLVIADVPENEATWGNNPVSTNQNSAAAPPSHLYWMIDAYTTSDRYPYADPLENDFNYIRNSVKVVVDAYHGSVHFFITETDDPIIQTWSRLLPEMFHPLAAMPPALLDHVRYPQDLFQVQSQQLMTYHMTDPQVFYNREDQWRAPNEIYASEERLVDPYYLIMKLPEEDTEEFILLRPFTPAQRNNLVAWLSARSDGDRYGRILLYQFPKQELVFGPEQIEARINQDPEISQRISLWNTQGSRAQQGNLLVIPIARSLLYVEPLYLEAEQNRLPILARVIVVYRNRIAMAESLRDALGAIFRGDRPVAPPVLRELGLDAPGLGAGSLPGPEIPE